jgi:hypothetical protein
VLLNIELAKAFDSVAWPFLLEVLEHVGFPLRWRDWISAMLGTASTRVLVNGRPGNRIRHARGQRQGDPLSPLLFMIVMEALNAFICEADRRALFVPLPDKIKQLASIYADDLVIFLSPEASDFANIRHILDLFAGASGLITNVDKCVITPIRCSSEQIDAVRLIFPCIVQDFPTRYLGAPLSLSKVSRVEEQRLVDLVAARILTWKGGLMTAASRWPWNASLPLCSPAPSSLKWAMGASTRFWTDAWLPAGAIPTFAPNLFKAMGRRRLGRSVKDVVTERRWVCDITGARTAPVLVEYMRLWTMLCDVELRPPEVDRFVWRWIVDGKYFVRSAYRAYFVGWTHMAGAKELWRAAVPPKVKFFF